MSILCCIIFCEYNTKEEKKGSKEEKKEPKSQSELVSTKQPLEIVQSQAVLWLPSQQAQRTQDPETQV